MSEPGPSGHARRDGSADGAPQGDEITGAGSLAGGFGVVPNAAWSLPLGQIAQALYVRLVCYVASGRGSCWPGQASLATDLGCTDRSIRNAMAELIARGLVTEQRRGRNLTNVYTVHGPEAHRPTSDDEGPEPRSDQVTGSTFRSGPDGDSAPDRKQVPGNKTRGAAPERTAPHPPTPAPQAGQGSGGRARSSRANGTNPRALAAAAELEAARGPEPEPVTAELEAAWLKIRAELHAAAPDSWALYLEPLTLRGTRGGELVLTAPYGTAGWVRDRFARLITAAVHHHISTDATVTVQEGAKAA